VDGSSVSQSSGSTGRLPTFHGRRTLKECSIVLYTMCTAQNLILGTLLRKSNMKLPKGA
jgi:hypothetical protein